MIAKLSPIVDFDDSFLLAVYASTRAEEMAVVPWSSEKKQAFLQMQFEAQNLYYRERYPNASFDFIKLNEEPIGKFYLAELADEIRIIDLAFLPQHFDKDVFIKLIEKVLQKGETTGKPVQIYLKSFNPLAEIFIDSGFQKAGEHGIYFLWRHQPAVVKAAVKASAINA
ncbi:MAG: GNAT family N-acetyltransferase [Pyrinomonadaceae bacterium]